LEDYAVEPVSPSATAGPVGDQALEHLPPATTTPEGITQSPAASTSPHGSMEADPPPQPGGEPSDPTPADPGVPRSVDPRRAQRRKRRGNRF
jgi:hypothetical protein